MTNLSEIDMAVLKRNDREDANVSEENCLYDLYLTESKELYFYHCGKDKWILSNLNGDDDYYESLKPIEKPTKEWLNTKTYEYKKAVDMGGHNKWIEIPEGAKKATKLGVEIVFWNGDDSFVFNLDNKWSSVPDSMSFNTYVESYDGVDIIWQRQTHSEELPFVNDECYTNKSNGGFKLPKDKPCDISKWSELRGESINDQYAEIEQVRQEYKSNHTGSDLPDFLFEDTVNHPSHYASGEIECIDAMEAMLTPEQFIGYLRGNAFKYQWRYENKGGITDLEKAQWYLNKLISRIS